jgi:choline dehydrogenase
MVYKLLFATLLGFIKCEDMFDYIVVGSGPAGSMAALELARHGFSTLLIEAGGNISNNNITAPGLGLRTWEDESLAWDFRVDYMDQSRNKRKNIIYPRASAIGGCANHNGMVNVYPRKHGFDRLVEATGDSSFDESTFRRYFESIQLESPPPADPKMDRRFLTLSTDKFGGLKEDTKDKYVLRTIPEAMAHESAHQNLNDKNAIGTTEFEPESQYYVPNNIDRKVTPPVRRGPRRAVVDEMARNPKLTVWTESLVTKVILEGNEAKGVEYMSGKHLYKASAVARRENRAAPEVKKVYARKEVVVSGGTFNTPQIMMLSGIGDSNELKALGIEPKVHLPGVGKNLRDHIEVGVVYELNSDFVAVQGCNFTDSPSDPCWQQYQNGSGVYTHGGPVHLQLFKSKPGLKFTDVWYYSILGLFVGFTDDMVRLGTTSLRHVSFVVLNPYSGLNQGTVTLTSTDPRDMPYINFRQYQGENAEEDYRKMRFGFDKIRQDLKVFDEIGKEVIPGAHVQSDEDIKEFIMDHTFSHHACGTMKIGKDSDPMAVLDSNFRVRGVKNLRVVDQSVMPDVIGDFPTLITYLLGLKAAEAILASNQS